MNRSSKGGEELELWNSRPGIINFEPKNIDECFKKEILIYLIEHLAHKSEAHEFDEQGGFYQNSEIYWPRVMVSGVRVGD